MVDYEAAKDLEQFFRERIAERDGIPVEEVTTEYIAMQEREIYAEQRRQIEQLEREVDEALAEF
jgi:hypothetical protein